MRCDEVEDEDGDEHGEEEAEGDEDVDLVDTEGYGDRNTMRERATEHVPMIRDGLEYQLQFDDQRFFTTLGREGASFLRFAKSCLSRGG